MTRSPQFKRVQTARAILLLDQPFFGVLALSLELLEDSGCKTAWTDGRSMGFNPAFVDTLSHDELTAVIAHEVMHCACGHPWRREARELRKFNVAADYAINGILQEASFKLPKSALLEPAYSGRWAEWIYDRLPDMPPQQGDDPSGLGEVRDAPAGSGDGSGEPAPTEQDWQQNVRQALKVGRWKLPASLQREIDEATRRHVDWRSLLRRYVQDIARADYTWSRPNVRYVPSGLYLPSLRDHALGRIAIAVDTSGSIDRVLLSQFAAEVQAIATDMQPAGVDVLYCDTKVHRVDTFERGETLTIDAKGGGGTSFKPVFTRLQDDPPAVLIYLTDLDGSFPSEAPDFPVIWAAYGCGRHDTAPFGDTVPCE